MAEGKGLLDFISSPAGQGLLAAGFGALAGRGTRTQAIGQGGLAGLLAYGQAQGNQADMARQKTQDAWMQTQRDWMSQDRARQEADRAKRETFLNDALTPKLLMQQSAAPDPQNDYTSPEFLYQAGKSATTPIPGVGPNLMGVRPVDPMAAIRSGFGVDEAAQLAQLGNLGKRRVKSFINTVDANGRAVTRGVDEFGEVVGEDIVAPERPVPVNLGNRIEFVVPKAGQSLKVAPTPYQTARLGAVPRSSGRQSATSGGDYSQVPGGDANFVPKPGKPMPASALKMKQDAIESIGIASSTSADLGAVMKQLDDGKLNLGPLNNAVASAKNFVGWSTESSRNYQSFLATLEKLRNDSLRLNKGVQTDGDAQRAWNELLANVNDPGVVKQRLQEIDAINRRAVELHQYTLDMIDQNYGRAPTDTSFLRDQPAAVGAGQTPKPGNRTVVRTGVMNGRRVVQYSDGSIEYADQRK